MEGIEESLFHRLEITFDLNILKNRLFSTMSCLISCARDPVLMVNFEREPLYSFVSPHLIWKGEKRSFQLSLFVFQEPRKQCSHTFWRNAPHVTAYKLFGFWCM